MTVTGHFCSILLAKASYKVIAELGDGETVPVFDRESSGDSLDF